MESRKIKIEKLKGETDALINEDITIENANQWMQTGLDYEFRRLDFNADIDENATMVMRRFLSKMTDISKELPIEIHFSTWGGELNEALAIYDMLVACPCPIIIVANGKVMSAGLPIFLAGNVRIAYPNTRFMMHSLSHKTSGKLKDTEIDVKEGRFLNNLMVDILVKHTKKNKKWWESKITSHDYFFGINEARELGILISSKPTKVKA